MIWWEKTVEYQFVLEMAGCGQQFLAPLDGKYEKAGDAITGMDGGNSWLLIEFKKDKKSIRDEKKKYNKGINTAWNDLQEINLSHHCHHIIYGVEPKVGKDRRTSLRLDSCMYWAQCGYRDAETKESKDDFLNGVLKRGVQRKEFIEYVKWLINQKKTSKRGAGGNLRADDYALVAAVSKTENGVVTCLSLAEFREVHNLAPSPGHGPLSGPSRRIS